MQQIADSLLAIPAFIPATVCTGYLTAWFTDLHGFRQRSLVERIFWSVPLSLGVSSIAAYLTARFFSLNAVAALFAASAVVWVAMLTLERRERRRVGEKLLIGFRPLGGTAIALALLWIAAAILSLVDWQSGHDLFMSLIVFDHGARVSWIGTILNSGVPPSNPMYWYKHPATMRNYYFWYVVCAAVVRMSHIPIRAVLNASCVWSGFALSALVGLYLKYFLAAGRRLRKQYLTAAGLLMVSGLDIFVHLWNFICLHIPLPGNSQAWTVGEIDSWYVSLLFVPHHTASLVCCMFAFLLVWIARREEKRRQIVVVVLIAVTLASAFGMSIYVSFAFFLVILCWALWQLAIERTIHKALLLAAGGAGASLFLIPYLLELTNTPSGMHGPSTFGFAVRETVPPRFLLTSYFIQQVMGSHPLLARNLANLLLLTPGVTVELGFFLITFLIYLVPSLSSRKQLSAAQRSILTIAAAAFLVTSFLRSWVLSYNDFGIRGSLLLQFSLLLLGSEVVMSWKCAERKEIASDDCAGLPHGTPQWLRSVAALAIVFGGLSTIYQALMFRFTIPLVETAHTRAVHDPESGNLSHNAYISYIGYAKLDALIPHDAIVQYNPAPPGSFWTEVDLLGVNRQAAIAGDKPWCGAELGGDPSGCAAMAAAIDSIYKGATAEQARATCGQYDIQYLVARMYDPVWADKSSWVWTLRPVVQDQEFRVLDCR